MIAKNIISLAVALAIPVVNASPCSVDSSSAPPDVCSLGEYACEGTDLAQCNYGQWVVWGCPTGTRCVEYDWECVPEADYDRVASAASSVYSATATPTATPTPPPGPCTSGSFQCYGNDVIQCDQGNWILWPCPSTSSCAELDYECVPFSDS